MAPSPFALRILLRECEAFGSEFDLTFNADKTRLIKICFSYNRSLSLLSGVFQFMEVLSIFWRLSTHLGLVLHGKLDDDVDVTRVTSAMCRHAG